MQYKCTACDYVYDEEGIDPAIGGKNVAWSELPEDWVCPKCDASKADFKLVEEAEEDILPDFE
ncbi:MAG: rubredoxin [Candidatus Paceibacterota bacterium]|jgi:rubredoxin-NAD+ reductase